MAEKIDMVFAVPKDKGWAWMCLLGAALVHFLVVGACVNSFGVFFKTIEETFNASATDVSWISAIMLFIMMCSVFPVNILSSIVGKRPVVVFSGLLMGIGYLLTAFAQTIQMMYLTYGFIVGVGAGLSYATSIIVITEYFEKRRVLASGAVFASSSVGAFCFPPLMQYFLEYYGTRGTFVIMAGIMFHICIAGMLFRPPQFYLRRYLLRESIRRQHQSQEFLSLDNFPVDAASGSEKTVSNIQHSAISENTSISAEECNNALHGDNESNRVPPNSRGANATRISGSDIVKTTTNERVSEHAVREETDKTTLETNLDMTAEEMTVDLNETETRRLQVISRTLSDVTNNSCCVRENKSSFDWNVLKNPLLYVYVLTLSIIDSSYVVCSILILPHATELGIASTKAVFLLSVMGICGGVSRLLTGWFSDLNLVKKKHIYQAATFASAVVYNLFPFFTQYASLAVICGMCSFFNGAVVVLAPVLLAEELGLVNLPITSGVMYSALGLFELCFTVFSGFLRDVTGSWMESLSSLASLTMFAAIVYLTEPWAARYGRRQRREVTNRDAAIGCRGGFAVNDGVHSDIGNR